MDNSVRCINVNQHIFWNVSGYSCLCSKLFLDKSSTILGQSLLTAQSAFDGSIYFPVKIIAMYRR